MGLRGLPATGLRSHNCLTDSAALTHAYRQGMTLGVMHEIDAARSMVELALNKVQPKE